MRQNLTIHTDTLFPIPPLPLHSPHVKRWVEIIFQWACNQIINSLPHLQLAMSLHEITISSSSSDDLIHPWHYELGWSPYDFFIPCSSLQTPTTSSRTSDTYLESNTIARLISPQSNSVDQLETKSISTKPGNHKLPLKKKPIPAKRLSSLPTSRPQLINQKFCQGLSLRLSQFDNITWSDEFQPCLPRKLAKSFKCKKMLYKMSRIPLYSCVDLHPQIPYQIIPCQYLNRWTFGLWQNMMLPLIRSGIHRQQQPIIRIQGTHISHIHRATVEHPMGTFHSVRCFYPKQYHRVPLCRLYFEEILPHSVITCLKLFNKNDQLIFQVLFIATNHTI